MSVKLKRKIGFNGQNYNIPKLIEYYYDKNLKDFKEGEVYNIETGEPICEIQNLFTAYFDIIKTSLNDIRNFSSPDQMKRIKLIYENEIKKLRIMELSNKLDNDEITVDEIEEWISLMSYKERNNFCIAKYTSYITINHSKTKPKELSDSDYGKFFRLIYIMDYSNQIKHSNGKPIKRANLAEMLEFKHIKSLDNYLGRLKKQNMLIKTEPNSKNVSFYMINPAYTMKQIEIDLTTYNYFKEDLDDLLSPLEKKYIELRGRANNSNHVLSVIG